jgi:hypothetical protein
MDLGTGTKKQKIKPRPCLIWSAEPLQRLLMSKFDGIDVNDPNFQCGPLLADYIRRRLLAVYPKPGFDSRRAITAETTTNRPIIITNTHLILIPVTVEERTKITGFISEFFNQDDMNYINSLLFELSIEEEQQRAQRKAEAIDKINYELILNNDDDDDNPSLPTTRSFFSNQYMSSRLSSLKKLNIIENKNFKRYLGFFDVRYMLYVGIDYCCRFDINMPLVFSSSLLLLVSIFV